MKGIHRGGTEDAQIGNLALEIPQLEQAALRSPGPLRPPHPPHPLHPLCRGDFAAVVFSGRTSGLGELPGEATAHALYKFAMIDPRLEACEDFARSPGMPLPLWPDHRLDPLDAVCFVFTDTEHPALACLVSAGAVADRHFVVLSDQPGLGPDRDLAARLSQFVMGVPDHSPIVILGYGHQGQAMAMILRERLGIASARLRVFDVNVDSRRQAEHDGLSVVDEDFVVAKQAGVIYSPLMRHERLHRIFADMATRARAALDNSQRSSGFKQFVKRGAVWLDAAADGALTSHQDRLQAKPHGLPLNAHVIREDCRRFVGVVFPHLHAGHQFNLACAADSVDLASQSPFDPLASETFQSMRRAFVSLRDRADHGFFAAREFCLRLWPEATRQVFPSEHVVDLGATSFERLLHGHLAGRELVSTMQTPAQRAALGIVARHYAASQPIVEIGSAFGGSALLVAAATDTHRPPIYSIDPEASTRDIMRFALEREGHLDRLQQIVAPSNRAISQLQHLRNQAGLVFIDGLHTFAGVCSDCELYAPLAAPGAALLFHDVCPQIYSVLCAVIERVLPDARFEIKCLIDGLAVFERRR